MAKSKEGNEQERTDKWEPEEETNQDKPTLVPSTEMEPTQLPDTEGDPEYEVGGSRRQKLAGRAVLIFDSDGDALVNLTANVEKEVDRRLLPSLYQIAREAVRVALLVSSDKERAFASHQRFEIEIPKKTIVGQVKSSLESCIKDLVKETEGSVSNTGRLKATAREIKFASAKRKEYRYGKLDGINGLTVGSPVLVEISFGRDGVAVQGVGTRAEGQNEQAILVREVVRRACERFLSLVAFTHRKNLSERIHEFRVEGGCNILDLQVECFRALAHSVLIEEKKSWQSSNLAYQALRSSESWTSAIEDHIIPGGDEASNDASQLYPWGHMYEEKTQKVRVEKILELIKELHRDEVEELMERVEELSMEAAFGGLKLTPIRKQPDARMIIDVLKDDYGMKLRDVAEATGIPKSTLGNISSGETKNTNVDYVRALVELLKKKEGHKNQ